ncbi:MAG: diguanylate cyclase [Helicobacteraceae bacterium]|nr:diguanylate cyclase [Helicobacteraceae bacterium]
MKTVRKVLIVDDSEDIVEYFVQVLNRCTSPVEPIFALTHKDAIEIINNQTISVILVELLLHDACAKRLVNSAVVKNIPTIVLTSIQDKKESFQKLNIVEYIVKENRSSLEYAADVLKRVLKNYDTTVLVVDDSKIAIEKYSKALKKLNLNVVSSNNAKEALELLQDSTTKISIVITDYNMPNVNGYELTIKIREKYKKDNLSIMIVSSMDCSDTIVSCLKMGANDYLLKPYNDEMLAVRVTNNLELLDLFHQTKEISHRDFLTSLFNRRYFFEASTDIFNNIQKSDKAVAIAMIDIDHFKTINDTYGHDIGDLALKEAANILKHNLRTSDLLARFGGEEFCILLDRSSQEQSKEIVENLRQKVEENVVKSGDITIKYTISIGLCYGKYKNAEEMIKHADDALYIAKHNGRNRVVLFDDITNAHCSISK